MATQIITRHHILIAGCPYPLVFVPLVAKKRTVQARIDEPLRSDFDWALEKTGMGETQFLEACIRAFIEYVRKHGGIWLPLQIEPKPPPAAVPKGQAPIPMKGPTGRTEIDPPPGLNEQPAIPVRESSPPKVTRIRAALRKMTTEERASKRGTKS